MGGDGTLYIAWREHYPGDVRDVVVARSSDGGRTFAEPVRVAGDGWVYPGCPHAGPVLAVAGDGVEHVAWYTGKESGPGLLRASSADGGASFSAPLPVLAEEWVPPSQARLAADREGRVWLVWEDRRAAPSTVRVARVSRGRLTDEWSVGGSDPAVAAASGGPAIAWLAEDRVPLALAWAP